MSIDRLILKDKHTLYRASVNYSPAGSAPVPVSIDGVTFQPLLLVHWSLCLLCFALVHLIDELLQLPGSSTDFVSHTT